MPKQSDLFFAGGAGAIAQPNIKGQNQSLDLAGLSVGTSTAYVTGFTVNTDGYYEVGHVVNFSNATATRYAQAYIYIDGSPIATPNDGNSLTTIPNGQTGDEFGVVHNKIYMSLNAGQTVELWGDSGASGTNITRGKLYITPVSQGSELVSTLPYEYGTWSPTVPSTINLSGSATITNAKYELVGKRVTATILEISGFTLTANNVRSAITIDTTSLPFTTNTTQFFGYAWGQVGNSPFEQLHVGVTRASDGGNSEIFVSIETSLANPGEIIQLRSLCFTYWIDE